jgi:1D-myo-inositol-tetrakisphosphate 5-kinase/inositol-polyphosphate multikinase
LYTDHATPARLTHRVLSDLDAQLAELEGVLRTLEIRAVGASLLVVYEGDATRLSTAFEHADARRVAKAARTLGQSGLGDNEEEDDSEDEFDSDEEDSSEEDDDDDDGVKADARRAARASPFALRLIDFAHTWFVEGQGPDEGVLFGFETVRGLVQGRMAEVKAWMDQYEPESPSKVASGFGSDAATASEEND